MRSTLIAHRFIVELLEDRTTPATFTVTTLADTGAGSLRDALDLANAMPDADIIRFDASLAGQTLGLTTIGDVSIGQSALFVTTPVTITGSGQTITRQGAIPFRLFAVSTSGTLSLQNLTLMNGFAQGGDGAAGFGGAVYNQGILSITGSTLSGNQAGGGIGGASSFDRGGGGGLAGPAVGDSGGPPNGGVPNNKFLGGAYGGFGGGGSAPTISLAPGGNGGFGGGAGLGGGSGGFGGGGGGGGGSNLGGDSPGGYGGRGGSKGAELAGAGGGGNGLGGAIFNQGGAVTITKSTIKGNSARGGNSVGTGQNGGGYGGSVFNLNGSVTFTNTTVAGNTVVAGSGGIANSANGGALYNASVNVGTDTVNQTATATISNSILSHDSSISSVVSNILDAASKGTATLMRTGPSILFGDVQNNGRLGSATFISADPNLGPLQDNGGFTRTMLPNAGSPAIDKGSNTAFTGLTTDQRGGSFVRIFNGTVDIGAVEVQPASAPVVIAPTSLPAGQVGTAYNQTITATGPAGPFTFAVTTGSLPVGLTLSSSGLLSGTPTTAATSSFTVTATGPALAVGIQTYIVTINLLSPPVLVGYKQFGVGQDVGGSMATLYNPDKSVRFSLTSFGSFTGGVRTTSADFNGDGVADLVVGTGPGRATQVVVLDGVTQKQLFTVDPFEATFTGGVYVAAGDLNGDGFADLAVTPNEGGGPRARVFNGKGFTQIADFFGIDDAKFRGGARAAIGNITGDGNADLVIAAGFGGGPRVAVFSGVKLASEGGLADQNAARWNSWKPFGDFLTFEAALRNGAFVAVGDLNGDGFAELVAGGGPGGGPRVTAFSGKGLLSNTQTPLANFFGGDVNNRGGVRVSVKNLDGDNLADVVVGSGTGAGSRVTAYAGKSIGSPTPPELFGFDALTGFSGGVFVG